MKKISTFIFLIGLVLFGCRDEKHAPQTAQEEAEASITDENATGESLKIADFVRNGPAFPVGNTLKAINDNFGEPLKKNIIDKQNIHNPEKIDQIVELFYEGLFLQVYHVTSMDNDIVIAIEITSEKYPVPDGLVIGSSEQKVLEVLGKPTEENGSTYRYFSGELAMGSVEFSFREKVVVSVRWNYFID
jgi:hypothetical protein